MTATSRRWVWPGVFLACVLAAGARSIALGQDANWDLKNYHWYNVWALFHGRLGFDLAPAQLQTFHNPTGDLPFYALVHALADPRQIAFWMASSAAIALFFLLRTLALLFPPGVARGNLAWIAAAAAIGATGAAGTATLGTTMNEWPPAALAMAALWLAVRAAIDGEAARPRGFALAAFLMGCAVGLKLTYGVFGLGFLAACLAFGTPRERLRRASVALALLGAGFLVFHGWWSWVLWREFDNPLFPYYNALFRSPWWEPDSFFDRNFGPRAWRQWVFFPLYFARQSALVSEVGFRDYRLATLLVLALLAWARVRIARLSGHTPAAPTDARTPAWWVLGVFTLASYLVWIKLFGIYRYLVPLELVSGPLIVALLVYLARGAGLRMLTVVVLASLLVGTTRPGSWGRIPFGERFFEVAAPELPPGSLVIVGHRHPMAYAIPFFRGDARFVSPANNFLAIGQRNRLATGIAEAIRGHRGPMFLMQHSTRTAHDERTLAHFGLVALEACLPIRSALDPGAMQLCALSPKAR